MTSINMQGTDVNMRQRNNYFDFLRAVAIIMIIGNHTCSVADLSVPRGLGNLAVLQILKSGVPIFLAISGYFLSRISFTDSKSYFQFLYKHLKHIYTDDNFQFTVYFRERIMYQINHRALYVNDAWCIFGLLFHISYSSILYFITIFKEMEQE